jgi:hypothetical protein
MADDTTGNEHMTDEALEAHDRKDLLARRLCEETANVVAALGMRIGAMPEAVVPSLVFLVDRAGFRAHSHGVLRGPWASTPKGPIHVRTRQLLQASWRPSSWGRFVHMEGPAEARTVRAVTNRTHDDLDLMSVASHRLIDGVAERFGRMTPEALLRWFVEDETAADCRPTDAETPITAADMLVAGGMTRELAEECAADEAALVASMDRLQGWPRS